MPYIGIVHHQALAKSRDWPKHCAVPGQIDRHSLSQGLRENFYASEAETSAAV